MSMGAYACLRFETHVSSVLRKLLLSNRYELSRWAFDRRLV